MKWNSAPGELRLPSFQSSRISRRTRFLLLFLIIGSVLCSGVIAAVPDSSPPTSPVKMIFIHHSTGEEWLADSYGGLGTALSTNNYFVSDTNYGWGTGSIGTNTDIGNWYDWFRGPLSGTYTSQLFNESGQHCSYSRLATDPGGQNTIIMFKSCFPNSALGGSATAPVPMIGSNPLKGQSCGDPDVHSVENAKGIYNDILTYFATRQDKLFIVVTAPPLIDSTYSANARAFNEWLMNQWLQNYTYKNVFVFDYYDVLTTNGGSNTVNDLDASTGNHHRFRNGAIEHIITGDNDGNPNVTEYATGDDHPSAAGDQKATGEFLPLLNIAYHEWQSSLSTGSLRVSSTPGGAAVSVDGVSRGSTGDTPLLLTGIPTGTHTVQITLPEYITYTNSSVSVTDGRITDLSPVLTPLGPGTPIFPSDHIWNVPVDSLPKDSNSDLYIDTIGSDRGLHPDFGSGTWEGFPIGIPYVTVPGSQSKSAVSFDYASESDPGPYPIPPNAPVEGNPAGDGDRHMLIVDRDNGLLYELYAIHRETDGWHAGSGAIFNLHGFGLRTDGYTSADAAGLAILPGLVRYEEVNSGAINHAIRFTVPDTRNEYLWPARHFASDLTDTKYPPMGQRFRLKANFDISGFSQKNQVILTALKKYGMILADNGASWYLSGVPDERWDNEDLHQLNEVPGSAFEAVDESLLQISPDSGQARVEARSMIGVFRPSTHTFYLDYNGNGVWNGASSDRQYPFGAVGDLPIAGDWNNNGAYEIGVFRPSTHTFYLDYNGNGVWNGASSDRQYPFGAVGDLPIAGDWNNNGAYEIGVFRPSTHTFYLDYNGNGVWNGASSDRQYPFGAVGDLPIAGDWNNNGAYEIGVYRPSTHTFYLDYNGNGVWNGASSDRQYPFGAVGDLSIAGDWNNNSAYEIGVFRPSTHTFYLDINGNGVWNGAVVDKADNFGLSSDVPVIGNWN